MIEYSGGDWDDPEMSALDSILFALMMFLSFVPVLVCLGLGL